MAGSIFEKLKRHVGIWRVDGIGEILNRGRLGAAATVYFSQIHEDHIHDAYRRPARTDKTLSLLVNSASLYEFKIGSLWENGTLSSLAPIHEYPLRVDVSRCKFHRLGKAAKLNDRWAESVIPEIQYRLGDNRAALAESLYAVMPVLGDIHTQWIVIPCSELLRFYFGTSSRLLSSVLRGTTDDYISWQKSRLENNSYVLHAKQRLSRREAAVLTRSLTSDVARMAMFGVHNHLSSIEANNRTLNISDRRPLVIKAGFPFSDETTLTVAGKRMRMLNPTADDKYGEWGVFAMQILVCPHSLGFDTSPIIESDDPFQNAHHTQNENQSPPIHYPFLPDEEELEINDLPANAKLKKLVILDFTNQFSALNGIRFQHARPQGNGLTGKATGVSVEVDGLSLEGKSHAEDAKSTLGVGFFQNQTDHIDRDITLFLKMLDAMHRQITPPPLSWHLSTRALANRLIEGNHSVTMFPSHIGNLRSWHKLQGSDGTERPRQVVIAEIKPAQNKFFYLLEMELKSTESGQCTIVLHALDFRFIENKEFQSLLKLTAIQHRWIDQGNKWKSPRDDAAAKDFFSKFRIHRINHPHVGRKKINGVQPTLDTEKWAELLLEKIGEIFH